MQEVAKHLRIICCHVWERIWKPADFKPEKSWDQRKCLLWMRLRNQFSWAHEVSAPISFQSLKYFAVLSALRFGRTGSHPNDIIPKERDVRTKSLLWSKKDFKAQDLVLDYRCRMTLLMFDNDVAKNHIKGKVCPKINFLTFARPLLSFQPVLLFPVREKQKKEMKSQNVFCCIQHQKSWFISCFNINRQNNNKSTC